jgi:hypothetical protein
MGVVQRGLILSAALALAVPAWAQTGTPADPARPQVQAFEMVLRGAVDLGGQRFAQRAAEVVPSVYLAPSDTPTVNGVPIREKGIFLFEVQVPGILQTGLRTYLEYLHQGPSPASEGVSGGAQPVSSGARVSANVSAPESVRETPLMADPDRAYSMEVRTAIIDAMLDSSAVLPLGADDTLIIVASGADPMVANPLYRSSPRKLILSIRGSDLRDFRDGKLTRDEALHRITETRF